MLKPPKKAPLSEAVHKTTREASLKDHICKVTKIEPGEPEPKHLADYGTGVKLKLQRFPYLPKKNEVLGEYGISLSARLLLKVIGEGSVLFMLMFILSIGALTDNAARSEVRLKCRMVAGMSHDHYTVLTNYSYCTEQARSEAAAYLGFHPLECGWDGLPIREFNNETVQDEYQGSPYFLTGTLGGCQEYRYCNASMLEGCDVKTLPQGPWEPANRIFNLEGNALIIPTPGARYCAGAEGIGTGTGSQLSRLLNVILIIVFLTRIRYLSQYYARHEDDSLITTSDYSLQFSGLNKNVSPGELKQQLWEQLEAMEVGGVPNYFVDRIQQIEVARNCRAEMKLMADVATIELEVEELEAKRIYKEAKGMWIEKEKAALTALVPKFSELRDQMKELIDEPDVSTGHAFVIFKEELDRNKCYSHFNPKKTGAGKDMYGSVEEGEAAKAMAREAAANAVHDASLESSKVTKQTTKAATKAVGATVPEIPKHPTATLEKHERPTLACAAVDDDGVVAGLIWRIVEIVFFLQKKRVSLNVSAAPEPAEINWDALELDDEREQQVVLLGRIVIIFILLIAASVLLMAKFGQFFYKLTYEPLATDPVSLSITFGITMVTIVSNECLKLVTRKLVYKEGQDTRTEEQSSAFTKLSSGLGINTVIVPMAVGMFLSNDAVVGDQTWYEPGGPISSVSLLIVINSVSYDSLQVFNSIAILKRYVLARFVFSERKLATLWKPVPFNMGEKYAYAYVMMALGILYGPLSPPMYFITSFGLFYKWICTRCAMRLWWAFPASINQEMMMSMRFRIGNVLGISLIVECLALMESMGRDEDGRTLKRVGITLVGAPICLFLYTFLPCGYIKELARFDQLEDTGDSDTDGMTFEGARQTGYDMPRYKCPMLPDFSDEAKKEIASSDTAFLTAQRQLSEEGATDDVKLLFANAKRTADVLSQYGLNEYNAAEAASSTMTSQFGDIAAASAVDGATSVQNLAVEIADLPSTVVGGVQSSAAVAVSTAGSALNLLTLGALRRPSAAPAAAPAGAEPAEAEPEPSLEGREPSVERI